MLSHIRISFRFFSVGQFITIKGILLENQRELPTIRQCFPEIISWFSGPEHRSEAVTRELRPLIAISMQKSLGRGGSILQAC